MYCDRDGESTGVRGPVGAGYTGRIKQIGRKIEVFVGWP
jgi:hypothetical protein